MPPRDHWPQHARQWALIGPPLRPCDDDVRVAAAEVTAWTAARRRAPRALLLGVTPELATMAWPAGATLIAIERSQPVIDAIFPAGSAGVAARGDWLALPLAGGSRDLALGDGSLSNLAFPAQYRALAAELRRVLTDDGRVILRLFAAPERGETLGEVADQLGTIRSFHAFKWRLAMAIQPDDRNVRVAEVWRAFEELVPDRAALAARTGWAPEVIATIDVYRDSDLVYSFPTEAEVRGALDGFVVAARHTPTYELGDRCSTLSLDHRTG